MTIREYFSFFESQLPEEQRNLRSTCLALLRGGISTMEQLKRMYTDTPERLEKLRDIGPKRMELIAMALKLYRPDGQGPPGRQQPDIPAERV